ncbi:MAG: nuclear transport factor 2 family protein [Gemmatimonadota bacterium]|nr:nuclear transport factor 2 family protein [Gemmatimonadota bacterium]
MRPQFFAGMLAALASLFAGVTAVHAQEYEDAEAIVGTALDYLEGWFEGDPDRMSRAVHEDLAKRIAQPLANGCRELRHMGKETLVDYTTRKGAGDDVDLRDKIQILDVFGSAAVVRADAGDWVDYLQLARLDDGWVIVNVLWELYPHASPPGADGDCPTE